MKYDVAAITIKSSEVIWVDGPYDAENADAVIKMAVMRQGVEDRFFAACKPKQYEAGDKWIGGVQIELPPYDPDYVTHRRNALSKREAWSITGRALVSP